MKKRLIAIAQCSLVLVAISLPGCGTRAETWAINQFWNLTNNATEAAFNYLMVSLFPALGNTTTTTTTTTTT